MFFYYLLLQVKLKDEQITQIRIDLSTVFSHVVIAAGEI